MKRRVLLALFVLTAWMLPASSAWAFCGFYVSGASANLYNNATMVVMMRDGNRTVLSMRNTYEGPPEDFAMVVPVPVVLQEENVKTLEPSLFVKVDQMAAPRLVEYWEQDPCAEPVEYDMQMAPTAMEERMEDESDDSGVKIEAQFTVAEYEVVVLSASDSTGLDRWLRDNRYNIPKGAEPVLKPYVDSGMYFFVAKVDARKVKFGPNGQAQLSPLRFHYDTKEFALPIRLGLINARSDQDLIVHILARNQRYEAANYDNVTIPTNIEVGDAVRERFGEFYAALLDQTMAKHPRSVVTEYAWDASTCDPCPGPNLDGSDFLALGGDTLQDQPQWGFVLTRLHARYNAQSLREDLVFKAAPPISGGREVPNANGGLEYGASSAGQNNFQGRYIIRHPWEGPVACLSPRRGIWGGPPGGGSSQTTPALDTAFAPRGALELSGVVRQDIPELDLKAGLAPISVDGGGVCGGCGCEVAPGQSGWPVGGWAAALVGVAFALWRRAR